MPAPRQDPEPQRKPSLEDAAMAAIEAAGGDTVQAQVRATVANGVKLDRIIEQLDELLELARRDV